MKHNTLYQYQGGGYSGCIWEWNFFFIDGEGKFHDIFSSGSGAITTIEEAAEAVKIDGTMFSYSLDNPEDLESLAKECNVDLVFRLVKWFEHNQNNEVHAVCSECGVKLYDPDDIRLEDYRGSGGAGIYPTILVCWECHSDGTCDCCEGYAGGDDIV